MKLMFERRPITRQFWQLVGATFFVKPLYIGDAKYHRDDLQ